MNKKLQFKTNFLRLFLSCFFISILSGEAMSNVNNSIKAKSVTFSIKNQSIKNFLQEIQKQTNLNFVYNDAQLTSEIKKSISVRDEDVNEVLNQLFKDTNLTYKVENNTITVIKKSELYVEQPKVTTFKIKGQVLGKANKKTISDATVINLRSNKGAITDDKGNFILEVKVGDKVEATFMGMKPLIIEVKAGIKSLDFALEVDDLAVDDVIVTGIFNKSRESYTGSVTTITEKEIKAFRSQNVLSTLRNIDPSLNLVQNNLVGSNPNALPEVNIRGNSSLPTSIKDLNEGAQAQLNVPYVVMDGFEISLQKLMDFNDDEIASINILKDAAATAIYGSRGANGVIVITTKSPQAGKLKLFVQAGVNIEIPDLSSYNLMNAKEKLALEKSYQLYERDPSSGAYYSNPSKYKAMEQYNKIYRDILSGVDTYWLSKPLQTAIGQRYNARLEGGNKEFRWSAALGYNENIGVMKNSDRNVFDGNVSLSYSVKNLIFRNQILITNTKSNDSNYGSYSQYTKMNPYWRTHDEKGDLIKEYRNTAPGTTELTANPLYDAMFNQIKGKNSTQFTNNFSIEWNIMNGFTARAKLGISKSFNRSDDFLPAQHSEFSKYGNADYLRRGRYKYNNGERFNYDGNITLSYSKRFADKHQVYAGLDYSLSENNSFNYEFVAEGFNNQYFDFLGNAAMYKKDGKPTGSESVSRRIGLTANFNYTYDNRYYIDLSYRVDGSSQFGSDNRYAPFYSAGIGWNIHREDFLQDNKTVNTLRLKLSYGSTGSQNFSPYQALSTYQYYTNDRYLYWNSAKLMGFGNKNLKWQITNQINAGFEADLFGSRIRLSADGYYKKTISLLSEIDTPLSSGFPSYADNVGEISNKGFEASLSGYIVRDLSRNIIWSITGKVAYNENKIDKLSQAIKNQNEVYLKKDTDINRLLFEGHSNNSIYAVRSLGIDPSNGEEIFLDKDGVATYNWHSNAKILCGLSEPKYRGNISSMFTYKGLTINVSFGYHFGGQQYNSTLLKRVEVTPREAMLNVDKRVLTERWLNVGDNKFAKGFYQLSGSSQKATKASTRFVQDDNMFSLQSASIQYRMDGNWIKKTLRMQSLNISVNMSDIFYITTIKRERGLDYPFARHISTSLSLIF